MEQNAFVSLAFLIVVLALVFGIWNLHEWIGAKADEAKERARRAKLENDRLEIEVAALKKAQSST